MNMKIEVKGKAWPEKYQKLLDRADELSDGSDGGRAVVWGMLACLANAHTEELVGKQVDTKLACLSLIMEAMLGGNLQVEKKQENEKPEKDAEKTPDPTANPAEGIDWEGMRKFRAKEGEAERCLAELRDAEAEWCALMPEMVNSASEKEAWTRLVTADERMRRTRSQLRRLAKIAMGYITEGVRT